MVLKGKQLVDFYGSFTDVMVRYFYFNERKQTRIKMIPEVTYKHFWDTEILENSISMRN